MDIEAWIQYASLLQEIQAGNAMRLSIAQREQLYRLLSARFREAPLEEKEALVALGTIWPAFAEAWRAASYERQQAMIQRIPMPAPLNASSLAYAEHALSGPLRPYAEGLTTTFPDLQPGPAP
jgi:hypothetical protein